MSSQRRRLGKKNVIGGDSGVSGDMSAASITSLPTNVSYLDNIVYTCRWTGAPIGVITINGSLDGSDWYALPGFTVSPQPAGTSSSASIDIDETGFLYLQVVYTKTSGTGTLAVSIGAKGK